MPGQGLLGVPLYRLPPRISLIHIYFSIERSGDAIQADAERTLNQLAAADQPLVRAPELGDPFALPDNYSLQSPQEVSQKFGQSFANLADPRCTIVHSDLTG